MNDFNSSEIVVNIKRAVPLDVALPCYGYVIPVVVLVTVVTNTFIIIVMSNHSLRTPTNKILLSMAVTEMLTGLVSFPWLLYYYTLKGYEEDMNYGMPAFWCKTYPYLSENLPRVFHTAAIWLSVLLAVRRYCTVSTIKLRSPQKGLSTEIMISAVCFAAAMLEVPLVFSRWNVPVVRNNRRYCVQTLAKWVLDIGPNTFFTTAIWFHVVFVYAGPCVLLVIYSALLMNFIRSQAKRRFSSCVIRHQSRLHSTSKMLVIIICIFLVTEIPAVVISTMHVLHMTFRIIPVHRYRAMNIAMILRNVFIIASHPFNFLVYLNMSEQFRKVAYHWFFGRILSIVELGAPCCRSWKIYQQRLSTRLIDLRDMQTRQSITVKEASLAEPAISDVDSD
ncbi:Sex peptide receptor [Trichinella pseudospiralis]